MKRILQTVLTLCLLASFVLAMPATALADETAKDDEASTFVFDKVSVLTDDQRQELEGVAQELASEHGLGVYLLFTDMMDGYANPTSSQRTSFATRFYRENDLGLGEDDNGILLAVAVKSRDYVTVALGAGSYDFNDDGIEAMEDAVTDQLGSNRWFAAGQAYYDQVDRQLAVFARTGRTASPMGVMGLLVRVFAIVGLPVLLAGGILMMERGKMKTAKLRNEAHEYLDPSSVVLTVANDQFVNTTMAVIPRVQASSGSGGGGGWGGGGGGGFSSSGGGKF